MTVQNLTPLKDRPEIRDIQIISMYTEIRSYTSVSQDGIATITVDFSPDFRGKIIEMERQIRTLQEQITNLEKRLDGDTLVAHPVSIFDKMVIDYKRFHHSTISKENLSESWGEFLVLTKLAQE